MIAEKCKLFSSFLFNLENTRGFDKPNRSNVTKHPTTQDINLQHPINLKQHYCALMTSKVCCAIDSSSSAGMTNTFTRESSVWISPGLPMCCLFLLSSIDTPKFCISTQRHSLSAQRINALTCWQEDVCCTIQARHFLDSRSRLLFHARSGLSLHLHIVLCNTQSSCNVAAYNVKSMYALASKTGTARSI